jgi:agmatine/peptidylarginine deiminase
LQVGGKIFLPIFDDPANDDAAIKRFGEIFGPSNIIPVPSSEIALGGGVLNCLSWEILY